MLAAASLRIADLTFALARVTIRTLLMPGLCSSLNVTLNFLRVTMHAHSLCAFALGWLFGEVDEVAGRPLLGHILYYEQIGLDRRRQSHSNQSGYVFDFHAECPAHSASPAQHPPTESGEEHKVHPQ